MLSLRSVFAVCGGDAARFLNGLCTQRLPMDAPGRYAAFLSSRGRVLFDAFLLRHPREEDTILVDCDRRSVADLVAHLLQYRLRSAVEFRDAASEYAVAASLASANVDGALAIMPDPRFPAHLGVLRHVVPINAIKQQTMAESTYHELRMAHAVAEGPREIPRDKAVPLEYNMDVHGGIDARKGCYMGQELVARTLSRGVVRKRLVPLVLSHGDGQSVADNNSANPLAVEHGTRLQREGGAVGRLVAVHGSRAIGLVRLESDAEIAERLPSWDECCIESADGRLVIAHVSRPQSTHVAN